MLSAGDQDILRQDRRLSNLDLLLDDERFAALLRQLYADANIETVTARYIRYKPQTSCLVTYDVTAQDGPTTVYARVWHPDDTAKTEKASSRPPAGSALGGGRIVNAADGLGVFPFPNDHELPALVDLQSPDGRKRWLEAVLPEPAATVPLRLEMLSYKPERRFVARLRGGAEDMVLRLYARGEWDAAASRRHRFADQGPLRVQSCLARSKAARAVVCRWIAGEPLASGLGSGVGLDPDALARAGGALGVLHRQPVAPRARRLERGDLIEEVRRAAVAITDVRTKLAQRAERLAERIAARLGDVTWQSTAVHGDFDPTQVVLQRGAVGLIDFDRSGAGDPRLDLGNIAAWLRRAAIDCGVPFDASARDALWAGYAVEARDVELRGLAAFEAAALLRTAITPFRTRHPEWPDQMAEIVAAAERAIDTAPVAVRSGDSTGT